jgi:site-specific recombinase XerD
MSRPPETLTFEESEKLLSQILLEETPLLSRWKCKRDYTMTLLMLDAGLRVGEVRRATVTKLIIVGNPVTALDIDESWAEKKCKRIVPCSERLKKSLKEMFDIVWTARPELQTGYAFFNHDATKPITTRQIQRIIGSASQQAFGREIHPHTLRHTFATNLLQVTDIKTVQYLLGHKNMSSTQVYTHTNGETCKKAIENMLKTT